MTSQTFNDVPLHRRHTGDVGLLLGVIRPWLQCYQTAVISYCGLRTATGIAILAAKIEIRILAQSELPAPMNPIATNHLVLSQYMIDLKVVSPDQVIERSFIGLLSDSDSGVRLLPDQTNGTYLTTVHTYLHNKYPAGARLPGASICGLGRHNVITTVTDSETLDAELKAHLMPYASLAEAMQEFGLQPFRGVSDPTYIDVVAESPAIITQWSRLNGESASVVVRAARELDSSRIRLGLRVLKANSPTGENAIERISVMLDEVVPTTISETQQDFVVERSLSAVRLIQAFLSYDNDNLHEWFVTDPEKSLNALHAVHTSVDPDERALKRLLFDSRSSQGKDFEHGVALLFNLLGCSTALHGQAYGFSDGADIVVRTPAGRFALVECTVQRPNHNGKLGKLSHRFADLRRRLNEQGFSYVELIAIAVTCQLRADIKTDVDEASRLGVLVGTREDLEHALNLTRMFPNADALYIDAKAQLAPHQTLLGNR